MELQPEMRRRGTTSGPPGAHAVFGVLLLPILHLAGAGAGAAQEPADTTDDAPDSVAYRLEGLTVEAARPVITGGGASAVEVQPDSLAMSTPSPTLAETIDRMPLIRVRQNSRGQTQPSLRGMEERQIAVLVDGVPITIGWDNRTDLSVVPVTGATRLTVVRGLSSVLAGPNALGGVLEVEVSQRRPPAVPPRLFRFRAAVEQTGALSGSAELNHLWRPGEEETFWLRYGGGYRTSPGDALPDGVPTAARAGDVLLNTGWTYGNAFVSGRWQDGPDGAWLAFSSTGFLADREVMPELHLVGSEEPAPRFWRIPEHWRSVTSVSAGTGWRRTPLGRGDLEMALGLDLQHLEIDDFASAGYDRPVGGEIGDDRTLTLRVVGDHTLGPGVLRGSLTLAETRHEQDVSGEAPRSYAQRLWSLGLESEQPLGEEDSEALLSAPTVAAGVSLDGASTPETGGQTPQPTIWGWGTRISGEAAILGGDGRIHGGVSRKVRFPALRELYSGALGKFAPNPELEPVTLKVAEVGATAYTTPQLELQAILFTQRLEGSIVRAVLPDGRFQRQNRGETRADGVELLANWRAGPFSLRGDLTLQSVELRGEEAREAGERPEYQPEVVANLHLDVPLPAELRARAGLEYLGTQYGADPRTGEFLPVDPTTYLEAGLSRRFDDVARLPAFRAGVQVENLTDEAIYDQLGLPRPGRTIRLQVQVQ